MAKLYPAQFWKRALAWCIDMAVLGVVITVLTMTYVRILDTADIDDWLFVVLFVPYLLFLMFLVPLYEQVLNGRTAGKRIVGIRVVDADGMPPTMSQSLRRYIMWIFDFVLTFFVGAWLSTMLTSGRRRIGDLLAGTMVVNDKPHNAAYNNIVSIYYTDLTEEEQYIFGRLSVPNTWPPAELAHGYQALECDIARLHTIKANPQLIDYADRVLSATHLEMYCRRCVTLGDSIKGTVRSIPLAIYETRWYIIAALLIAIAAYSVGVYSQYTDLNTFYHTFGARYYETTVENIENGNPMGIYSRDGSWDMFGSIFMNNFIVTLRMFIIGVVVLVGPLFFLVHNFVMYGVFDAFFMQQGETVAALVSPNEHGVLELGSIIIAAGAALRMGLGWVFPGRMTRLRALTHSARQSVQVMLSTVPMLLVAAVIESFITRHTEWPMAAKMTIIVVSFLFILFYYVVLPLRSHRS